MEEREEENLEKSNSDENNNTEKEKTPDDGEKDVFARWQVYESDNHQKSKKWFVLAGLIFTALLIYAFFTKNFSFAVILIIAAAIIIIKDNQPTKVLDVRLSYKGVKVGDRFFDIDKLKKFAIIYKPEQDKKALIFEFKNGLHPEMIIPFNEVNPLPIRENLLKYLEEDLERDDIPTTDMINRLLKL